MDIDLIGTIGVLNAAAIDNPGFLHTSNSQTLRLLSRVLLKTLSILVSRRLKTLSNSERKTVEQMPLLFPFDPM
jgi:hypothetical protein